MEGGSASASEVVDKSKHGPGGNGADKRTQIPMAEHLAAFRSAGATPKITRATRW